MGKMMNFGRRTTPLTTDPQGRRITDPSVYKTKVGTGADQRIVGSWSEVRDAYWNTPVDQRQDYTKQKGPVADYILKKTDKLDDQNYEEPTYQKGNMGNFSYTLKKDSPRYKYIQGEYAQPYNRERTKLYADSDMSQQEWLKQPDAVRYNENPLTDNPPAEGMQYDFSPDSNDYSRIPGQTYNIRYVKPKAVAKPKEVAKPVITSKVETSAAETEVTAPVKKEVISKKDLESMNLPLLKVGKIATQQGGIKRIVDPNEPVYKGAGMLQDTRPKAQKVQQETGYDAGKWSEAISNSYDTGERMNFTGGAVNKKDLRYQSRYNKQYDKYQAEKDKNPMNNKTLDLFYNRFK